MFHVERIGKFKIQNSILNFDILPPPTGTPSNARGRILFDSTLIFCCKQFNSSSKVEEVARAKRATEESAILTHHKGDF